MSEFARGGAQRRWDQYDAYIFDIDDTLLHCDDAVHYFAFCTALALLGSETPSLDGVAVHGSTDLAILRDALRRQGIPDSSWRPRLAESCASMCAYVDAHCTDFSITVLPGVREMLNLLASRNAVAGLGTGNLEGIARAKLRSCGLADRFRFGGFSDGCERREDILCKALDEARALAGSRASVCVVGDTPADISAARHNHLDAMAVATGTYAWEELAAHRPDFCVPSLADLPGA